MRLSRFVLPLLLACSPAAAQEFSQHWDFDFGLRPDGRPLRNIWWVSTPLASDIPDIANTAAQERNKCVGDSDGPALTDGVINSDDLICLWFTGRGNLTTAGVFTLSRWDAANCMKLSRNAAPQLRSYIAFWGSPFELVPHEGLEVELNYLYPWAPPLPSHDADITGDEPDVGGVLLGSSPTCTTPGQTNCCSSQAPRYHQLRLPYGTLIDDVDEILCGLEGVDWVDSNLDNQPDSCWDDVDADGRRDAGEALTGLWDGIHPLRVGRYLRSEGITEWRHAVVALGRARFLGRRFPLQEGESYRAWMGPGHEAVLWDPATR